MEKLIINQMLHIRLCGLGIIINSYVLQVEAFKNGYNLTSFPKDTYDVFQASVLSWL